MLTHSSALGGTACRYHAGKHKIEPGPAPRQKCNLFLDTLAFRSLSKLMGLSCGDLVWLLSAHLKWAPCMFRDVPPVCR